MASETSPAPATTSPQSLTAADLKAAKARPRKVIPVDLPDGSGRLHVRSLTGLELDLLQDSHTDEKGKYIPENVRAKTFAMCACDPQGKPLFPFTPDAVKEIGEFDGPTVIEPVYNAALKLNRLRAVDRADEKNG